VLGVYFFCIILLFVYSQQSKTNALLIKKFFQKSF
jgi:hypothetical protein